MSKIKTVTGKDGREIEVVTRSTRAPANPGREEDRLMFSMDGVVGKGSHQGIDTMVMDSLLGFAGRKATPWASLDLIKRRGPQK